MNTQKLVGALFMALSLVACSGDDNSDSPQQMTNEELIIGKWYFESKTPGSYSDCEKMGYIDFRNDGTETQTATIQSISQSELVVIDTGSGDVNTFDRTAG